MKTERFTFLQIFSLIDGRLSTEIDDVYKMLNFIFDTSLMTHQLPTAMKYLKKINPDWFNNSTKLLDNLKSFLETDDFGLLIKSIKDTPIKEITVFQNGYTKDFQDYMVENSILFF